MAGFALAEAFVRIRPDSTGFRVQADQQITAALAGLDPEVPVGADTSAAKVAVADLRAYVDALASKVAVMRILADDKELQAALARDFDQLLKLQGMTVDPEITLRGITQAQAQLLSLDASLDKVAHTIATAHVQIDDLDTEKRLALLNIQLMDLTAQAHDIRLGVTDPGGLAAIDKLQEKLDELRSKVVSVGFLESTSSAADAMRQILMLKRLMQTAGLADFLDVNLKPSQIMSQLIILKQRLQAMNLSDTLGLNIDQSQLQEQITQIETELNAIPDVSLGVQVSGLGGVAASLGMLRTALGQLSAGNAAAAMATLAANATALTGAAGSAGNGGGGGSGLLGAAAAGGFFGNALTTLHNRLQINAAGWATSIGGVAAWHVALDAVIEATISVGLALVALGAGIAPLAESAMNLGEHLQAVDYTSAALGVNIPPLTGKLDALAHAMAPAAIELYGAGLNVVNTQAGALLRAAGPVVTLFEDWAAKIVIWMQAQNQAGKLLQSGTGYLQQFGQIIGTLGQALGNLLKEDPGIAHYLLDIVQAVAYLLKEFTLLPAPIVAAVLGLHGLYVWGSVLAAVLDKLGGYIGTIATKLPALAANPLVWVAAVAAAIGLLIYNSTQADKSTKNFIDTLNAGLANDQASTAINQIATDIGEVNARIQATTTTQALRGWSSSWQAVGLDAQATGSEMQKAASSWVDVVKSGFQSTSAWKNTITDVGNAFKDLFVPGAGASIAVKNDIQALNQEMIKLQGNEVNLFKETGNLTMQGYTYSQALALMDLAGVRVGDSMAVMQAKISNLLTGYKSLGLQGNDLANTVNAVTFAMLQQNEKVGQVNSGWDAFENTIQGGETNLSKYANTLANMNNALGKGSGAVSNFTSGQRQILQTFSAAAGQANTYMDSLTTLANAAGMGQTGVHLLDQATMDLVASMLPAAKNSHLLTAELYAMAQRGGYQGADSFQALTKWTKNVHDPMQNLDKITTIFTTHAGNLTQDVKNLSMALGTTLNSAMATAAFDASGGQKAFDNFAKAVQNTTTDSQQQQTAALQLAISLQKLTGNTSDTKKEFITFAEDALHLTQSQADLLWQQTFPKLQSSINNLHGTNIPVTSTVSGSGTITMHEQVLGKNSSGYLEFHAAGGKVGGTGGSTQDNQLIAASSGEWVMPVSAVNFYGPRFMAAIQKRMFHGGGMIPPGYAVGGLVNKIKEPWGYFSNWEASNASTWGGAVVKAGARIAVQAYQAAVRKAASQAIVGITGGNAGANAGAYERYALSLFPQHGWSGAQMVPLVALWTRESGWNPLAMNQSSGAFGIAQALGHGLPGTGGRYGNQYPSRAANDGNAAAQIQWGEDYIAQRYGNPAGAWASELSIGSYDGGGWLKPGFTLAWNGTGRLEKVTPPRGGNTLQLEFSGRRPDRPLESALWDWIVGNVRIKGAGDVQLAMGTA